MEDFKPEAACFFPEHGQRSGFFIVNVTGSPDLARISECFWFGLHADVSATPVVNGEDLARGLGGIAGIVKRYAQASANHRGMAGSPAAVARPGFSLPADSSP